MADKYVLLKTTTLSSNTQGPDRHPQSFISFYQCSKQPVQLLTIK